MVSLFVPVFSRSSFPDPPAEEQAEPGAELQAAAAEGQPEQAQPGGGRHGQARQRAERPPVEEEGGAAAEREPAGESEQCFSQTISGTVFKDMPGQFLQL